MALSQINELLVTNALWVTNLLEQTNELLQPISVGTFGFELENGTGVILLESGFILLLENSGSAPYWQPGDD